MKPVRWLPRLFILLLTLVGCSPVSSTIQPTLETIISSPTNLQATNTVAPISTPISAVTETPIPTSTLTPFATLDPKIIEETVQPLLQDPMNCTVPCFWGITPGKTSMDEARLFFSRLRFSPYEGKDPNSGGDFYSIAYESSIGRNSYVTLYPSSNRVANIVIKPEINKQNEDSPWEWTVYSPETLIKKYGQPSHVDFYLAWPGGGGSEVIINMYFDTLDLIVQYTGENMLPTNNHSPQLCPLTTPFDYVRLWLGPKPPDPPPVGVPLEQATSLTMDMFTQLMLGDPQDACFTIKGDVFQ